MELSPRKLAIIEAIVKDFILTGTPIGSRTLSKKYVQGLSSATLRNEMSDLEEMGYLEQPHTSAGRIPSDKAYRLYVDHLMQVPELSAEEAAYLRGTYHRRADEVEQVIRQAARVISDTTSYTSMVLAPQVETALLQHVQLVPVGVGVAMVILVTDIGVHKDAVIRVPDDMTADDLYEISRMMTARLCGRPVSMVPAVLASEMGREFIKNRMLFERFIQVVEERNDHPENEVVLGGTTNLFNYPEYSDIEKAKALISVLENKDLLHRMLHDATKLEFTVTIGGENKEEAIKDCSVVTATYRIGGHSLGSIGVIGPTRMQYSKVLAVLSFMGRTMSNLLEDSER